jgi:hypothetical protein
MESESMSNVKSESDRIRDKICLLAGEERSNIFLENVGWLLLVAFLRRQRGQCIR